MTPQGAVPRRRDPGQAALGKDSQSEKQRRDVFGVVSVQRESLDYGYLHRWAAILGVAETLNEIIAEAKVCSADPPAKDAPPPSP